MQGPTIVCIEGGIGAGKSTIIDILQKKCNEGGIPVTFVGEPVDIWNEKGLLKAMYDGTLPKASFQLMAMMSRGGRLLRAINSGAKLIVTERSPWSDAHVFAAEHLEGIELSNYMAAHQELISAFPENLKPVFVHINTPIATALQRVNERGRTGEEAIEIEYMKSLASRHEAFFKIIQMSSLYTVDGSAPAIVSASTIYDILMSF